MRKEIREVDKEKGIVQVTIADERWYLKPYFSETSGIPQYKGVPSVTWIAGSYPKGIGFYKWLAEKGWDEAESIKTAAGDKGSKVHLAIGNILAGIEVKIDSKFLNKSSGQEEELTLEECDCLLSFINWKKTIEEEYTLKTIISETAVFSDIYNYAGTVDWIIELTHKETGEVTYWIIDFKTGQYIWKEYELQISAYRKTIENSENVFPEMKDVSNIKTAILQLGYRKNKAGYKFTILEDKFDLFLTAQKIWHEEHGGEQPSKKDYPLVISPAIKVEEVVFETVENPKAEENFEKPVVEQSQKRARKRDA